MRMRYFLINTSVLLMSLGLYACRSAVPRVFFANIENGARVTSPVHLEWTAEGFTIEPAGEVREGAGHLHIMVNVPCVAAGEIIAADASQLHLGEGQTEADIELGPNQVHTLCLQAADGEHRALPGAGMTQEISIIVEK